MTLPEALGWAGASLILAAYALNSYGRLAAQGWVYQALNGVGAIGVLVAAATTNNWPTVALNSVWLLISLAALLRLWRLNH